MRQWAREKAPAADVDRELEKFVNHWKSKAGSGATKLDWMATWRNWMLSAQGYAERGRVEAVCICDGVEVAGRCSSGCVLAARGITLDEYRDHYEEPGWLEEVERKAGIALSWAPAMAAEDDGWG